MPVSAEDVEVKTVKSDQLSKAFVGIVGEMAVQEKERTGELPEGATRPEFIISRIQAVERNHPGIFAVTKEQEARFAAGNYDEEENRKAMKLRIRHFAEKETALPTMHVFLIKKFNEDKLRGAELEFAVRLLSSDLEE